MYIKIYFNDKPLFLCNKIDAVIEPYTHHDDAVFIDELDSHTVKSMIHEMQQENVHAGVFLHNDLPALQHAFYKKFTLIQAAGGLVTNEANEILMIYRRGKWDLPKGKLDAGETLAECAVREVEEETGLRNIELIVPLITTYHTYHEGSRFMLKESYWYTMHVKGKQQLVPQTAEDIHDIKWVNKTELETYKNNSFPSVVDVLQAWAAV
jgi:8-oxo-dGTP pyrophosphatase MutT (NUDIX family)